MFYTKMSFSFIHGIYCIDNFVEHARLLKSISKGVCTLDSSAVPEKYETYFTPYIIESMEFEYVNLSKNSNRIVKREFEQSRKQNLNLRMIDNLQIDPVKSLFVDKLTSLMKRVRMIKCHIDLLYALVFKGFYILLWGCDTAQEMYVKAFENKSIK